MGDSRSFRDAFSQRKAPARKGLARTGPASNGLGGAPDKFRSTAAADRTDAFRSAGDPAPVTPAGDAFAPKAKPAKSLRGASSGRKPEIVLQRPVETPAVEKIVKPKLSKAAPSKSAPPKLPKAAIIRTAPLTPVRSAQVKPQKMTASLVTPPAGKLTRPASPANPGLKNPFGRKDAKTTRPKALVPAAVAAPPSPMTRPAAKPVSAKAPPPAKDGLLDELAWLAAPAAAEQPAAPDAPPIEVAEAAPPEPALPDVVVESEARPEEAQPEEAQQGEVQPDDVKSADAARAPLQIVANESVLDHTDFRKFRRAARSSSLVLVSTGPADAIASTDILETAVPETEEVATIAMAAEDPETRVIDRPATPTDTPPTPAPEKTAAAASPGGDGPTPAAAAKAPEPAAAPPPPPPPAAEPAPEAAPAAAAAATVAAATAAEAAAATAEKPIEVVEAIVEPPASVPYDTASVPEAQLAAGPKRKPVGTTRAVETSWQDVAGGKAAEGQPAAAVLRKVETAPVAGYWDGATAGAKSALKRRGFNQDDIFGVVFGIAVLAFLLLWFMRGRGEETPAGDLLATPQSLTGQQLAAAPAPAPAPKVDPFGDAPVNLKPTGPIPEATPGDTQVASAGPPAATPAPAAPLAASPPVVAANPEAAIPLAERKMHAWFCTASSRMTKSSRTELKGQMAKFEDVFAGKELVVRGYADTRGSIELNADLGSRRAQTVADYLTSKGLVVVDVQGVGELNGLDDNQNCANQRRVDVWVKGGPAETPSRLCAPEPDAEALVCS